MIAILLSGLTWLYIQIKKHWTWIIPITLILGIVICVGLVSRCSKPVPHLNEGQIKIAQDAIAVQDRKTMVEILAKSDAEVQNIDSNVANSKTTAINAIEASKKKYQDLSNEDLAKELNARSGQ